MKEAIIVGWINKGKPADCGETMKNQLIIEKLENMGVHCLIVDFKGWRKHPWVFLQLAWYMIAHKSASLILSTSAQNVYPLMKLMKMVGWKQNTIHWVIGGSLGEKVKQKIYKADVISYMKYTLVESNLMKEQLESENVTNVIVVPNFKPIHYLPSISKKYPVRDSVLRFVFLSRVMPEKGCDYILEASKMLNTDGYENRYKIDFYGKFTKEYEDIFYKRKETLNNVKYCGFMNLRENEGYDILSKYDIFLFPTYWKGEGFAGVFIDTFISGVPMIITDWAHNKAFMKDGKTALFIPVHNVIALYEKMKECIDGKYDISLMSCNCQKEALQYDVNNVITKDLLKEIGVL